MAINLKPLADRLVVEPIETDEVTTGGVLLPETAKEKPQKGKIVSLGQGKLLDDGSRSKFQVKKGDEVLFTSYAGTEVKVGDKDCLIMDESEILAVMDYN